MKASVIGLCIDENSSYLRGSAAAPAAIRAWLKSGCSNFSSEAGPELPAFEAWSDAGDVQRFEDIEDRALAVISQGRRLLSWGGDHSVTAPLLKAHSRFSENLTVLHFDAHPDLYPEFEGNPYSHACPFYRALQFRHCKRLIQLGIRTLNGFQREQVERFGVEQILSLSQVQVDGPVYVSIDLDVLDPAFAPGVSHHEPGGWSTRQLLDELQKLPTSLVGADIVELNPSRDHSQITTAVAAKLSKELLVRLS